MKEFVSFLLSKIKTYPPYNALLSAFAYEKYPIHADGLKGSLIPLILSELFSIGKASFLIILPYDKEAKQAAEDFRRQGIPACYFPELGQVPYSDGRRDPQTAGERLHVLQTLTSGEKCVVTASLRSLLQPTVPPQWLRSQRMKVTSGKSVDPQAVEHFLVDGGYLRVPRVTVPGEFAVRGEVIDVFMPGQTQAVRIVCEWDTVEKIRYFDPVSQESSRETEAVFLYLASEYRWSDERIDGIAEFLKKKTFLREKKDFFLSDLKEMRSCAREEWLYPISFEHRAFLTDYLKEKDVLISINPERFGALSETVLNDFKGFYARARAAGAVIPTPEEFLQTYEEALSRWSKQI